ncbi:type 4a pilus biogenesis protein PilO [Spiribacter sp. C176]|uniref:Type 4a pilus biogenesis protein PilO n=1 Tax=Spiribacter salilacus TaxID=2664894 RepID=A0A6N7QQV3_9GAMM|nr:type 4a pilus biogenesis protein PilO [Spiribacter salilacus]MRH78070.1 type 4a pilus biogenesis protein PilO [Spiribacter salilacus]
MRLPIKRRLITFCFLSIALLAGLLLSWPFFGGPAANQLSVAQSAELSLRKALQKQQAQAANLNRYEAQLRQMQTRYVQLLEQLPEQLMLDSLLAELDTQAQTHGLSVIQLTPRPATEHGFYTAVPIEIALSGQWEGIYTFIHQMALLSRMVTLDTIEITPLSARLTLITYWQGNTEATP